MKITDHSRLYGGLASTRERFAKEPVTLWSIGFNGTGETDLEKRDGATFNLHNETDCAEIVLTALESSLARQPSR